MIPNFNDPKQLNEYEQSIAFITDYFPRVWYSLYINCIQQGFTEVQSLELVKEYIKIPLINN